MGGLPEMIEPVALGRALWRNITARPRGPASPSRKGVQLLGGLILLAGCHIQLVSDYDDQFVKDATEIQKEIDTLLQDQRNPVKGADLSYEASKPAYNKIEVDLSSLLTLAQSHKMNDPTINQVGKLIDTVRGLERIHQRDNRLPPFVIDTEQVTIRDQISSIVRTENAKKAGT
jgi:hypothetical protein